MSAIIGRYCSFLGSIAAHAPADGLKPTIMSQMAQQAIDTKPDSPLQSLCRVCDLRASVFVNELNGPAHQIHLTGRLLNWGKAIRNADVELLECLINVTVSDFHKLAFLIFGSGEKQKSSAQRWGALSFSGRDVVVFEPISAAMLQALTTTEQA